MKRIILAFDSFKGCASSQEIAAAARQGITDCLAGCEVVTVPVADGGEGTAEAICASLPVERVSCRVHDPLMCPIEATYGITADGTTAVMEMAAASGLPLVPPEKRNPLLTTTWGTGEMIADALSRGCRRIVMGIGGSATNDAGTGLLAALGYRFLDDQGEELFPAGKNLERIDRIDESGANEALSETTFTIACDVNNPFYGTRGCSRDLCPPKGRFARRRGLVGEGHGPLCPRDRVVEAHRYFDHSGSRSCRWIGRRYAALPSGRVALGHRHCVGDAPLRRDYTGCRLDSDRRR